LNCDTNWPMLTPCWPRAGPTGGAGVAWPPGTCNLICAVTCRAMVPTFLHLLHLPVFQLHRHAPAEDRQLDAHAPLGLVQFLDLALHAGEGAVGHLDAVARAEARLGDDDLLAALLVLLAAGLAAQHALDLALGHRRRRPVDRAADEVADAG